VVGEGVAAGEGGGASRTLPGGIRTSNRGTCALFLASAGTNEIRSPSKSRAVSTCSPLTKVPLLLPLSVIEMPLSSHSTRAWAEPISGVSSRRLARRPVPTRTAAPFWRGKTEPSAGPPVTIREGTAGALPRSSRGHRTTRHKASKPGNPRLPLIIGPRARPAKAGARPTWSCRKGSAIIRPYREHSEEAVAPLRAGRSASREGRVTVRPGPRLRGAGTDRVGSLPPAHAATRRQHVGRL
jgi:hypothetical protein